MNLFPDFRLLAGSGGVFNTITTITVFDSPDVDKWLRGGELLIGSAYIFREDLSGLEDFLKRVQEQGASAVGVKLDRFLGEIPKKILDFADEIELPLILIPFSYRWADIIEVVQRHLNTAQNVSLQKGAEAKLLEDFLDPTELIRALAKELRHKIAFWCPSLGLQLLVSSDGTTLPTPVAKEYFEAKKTAEEQLSTHGTIQVTRTARNLNSETVSAVYSSTGQARTEVHLILKAEEKAPSLRQERLSMLVLNLIRSFALEQILGKQTSLETKSTFLERLCLGGFSEQRIALQRASVLGIVVPEPCFVSILHMIELRESPEKGEEEAFVFHIGHLRVSIIPWFERKNHLARIFELCRNLNVWGVFGRKAEKLLNIQESYMDCKNSLSILKKTMLPPGAYGYEEAVLFSLFHKMAKTDEGQVLINRYWHPLLAIPEENRMLNPVQVVEGLVKNGFNAKRSAADLHVHYNTIRNYISEIQSKIGLDFNKPMDLLILTMCYFISQEKDGNGRWDYA